MTNRTRNLALATMLCALTACATTSPSSTGKTATPAAASAPAADLKSRLIGTWSGELMGMPMELEYTDSVIKIAAFGAELPYKLEGDVLSMDVMGQEQKSKVTFQSNDVMIQTNVATGEVLTMNRKK